MGFSSLRNGERIARRNMLASVRKYDPVARMFGIPPIIGAA